MEGLFFCEKSTFSIFSLFFCRVDLDIFGTRTSLITLNTAREELDLFLLILFVFGFMAIPGCLILLRKMLNEQINSQLDQKIPKRLQKFVGISFRWM